MKTFVKSWFTLVEMVIAISIFFILALAIYAPYSYYWNKIRLKQSVKETVQILYDARNMAVNWTIWSDENLSVWVYLDTQNINKLKIVQYSHDIEDLNIDENWAWTIREYSLQRWIQIDSINNWWTNLLFFFEAITWNTKYYTFDNSLWTRDEFTWDEIDIDFSYKWSESPRLQSEIIYFTNTNIADY